jgi:hypothetical protein
LAGSLDNGNIVMKHSLRNAVRRGRPDMMEP